MVGTTAHSGESEERLENPSVPSATKLGGDFGRDETRIELADSDSSDDRDAVKQVGEVGSGDVTASNPVVSEPEDRQVSSNASGELDASEDSAVLEADSADEETALFKIEQEETTAKEIDTTRDDDSDDAPIGKEEDERQASPLDYQLIANGGAQNHDCLPITIGRLYNPNLDEDAAKTRGWEKVIEGVESETISHDGLRKIARLLRQNYQGKLAFSLPLEPGIASVEKGFLQRSICCALRDLQKLKDIFKSDELLDCIPESEKEKLGLIVISLDDFEISGRLARLFLDFDNLLQQKKIIPQFIAHNGGHFSNIVLDGDVGTYVCKDIQQSKAIFVSQLLPLIAKAASYTSLEQLARIEEGKTANADYEKILDDSFKALLTQNPDDADQLKKLSSVFGQDSVTLTVQQKLLKIFAANPVMTLDSIVKVQKASEEGKERLSQGPDGSSNDQKPLKLADADYEQFAKAWVASLKGKSQDTLLEDDDEFINIEYVENSFKYDRENNSKSLSIASTSESSEAEKVTLHLKESAQQALTISVSQTENHSERLKVAFKMTAQTLKIRYAEKLGNQDKLLKEQSTPLAKELLLKTSLSLGKITLPELTDIKDSTQKVEFFKDCLFPFWHAGIFVDLNPECSKEAEQAYKHYYEAFVKQYCQVSNNEADRVDDVPPVAQASAEEVSKSDDFDFNLGFDFKSDFDFDFGTVDDSDDACESEDEADSDDVVDDSSGEEVQSPSLKAGSGFPLDDESQGPEIKITVPVTAKASSNEAEAALSVVASEDNDASVTAPIVEEGAAVSSPVVVNLAEEPVGVANNSDEVLSGASEFGGGLAASEDALDDVVVMSESEESDFYGSDSDFDLATEDDEQNEAIVFGELDSESDEVSRECDDASNGFQFKGLEEADSEEKQRGTDGTSQQNQDSSYMMGAVFSVASVFSAPIRALTSLNPMGPF